MELFNFSKKRLFSKKKASREKEVRKPGKLADK